MATPKNLNNEGNPEKGHFSGNRSFQIPRFQESREIGICLGISGFVRNRDPSQKWLVSQKSIASDCPLSLSVLPPTRLLCVLLLDGCWRGS